MNTAGFPKKDSRKPYSEQGLTLLNDKQTHRVEVSKALNQWSVMVTEIATDKLVTQDFFNRRWEAVARAEDFINLLNRTQPPPGW